MKPNFALTLSVDGITLLHRAFPGWKLVGEVALDEPDLGAALEELRRKGDALEGEGYTTKLVLPNEQIKYIQIDAFDAAADEPEDAVREHLTGATPYNLHDLAYDWAQHDGVISIAAVARETLQEAENFAQEHGFNPVGFVTVPDPGDFLGEPFFGEARNAAAFLSGDECVDRDSAPVRVIVDVSDDAGDVTFAQTPATAELHGFAEPSSVSAQTDEQDVVDSISNISPASDEKSAVEIEAIEVTRPVEVSQAQSMSVQVEDIATIDSAVLHDSAVMDPPVQDIVPDDIATPATIAPTFTSIRARRDELPAASAPPPLQGVARDVLPAPLDEIEAPAAPFIAAPQITATPETESAEETQKEFLASLKPIPSRAAPRIERPAAAPHFAPTHNSKPMDAASKPVRDVPSDAENETERMTVFGARKDKQVGGKPRYLGLILTAALLIFLVGIAAWAAVFLDDGLARFFHGDDTPKIAETAPESGVAGLTESRRPQEPLQIVAQPNLSLDTQETDILKPNLFSAPTDRVAARPLAPVHSAQVNEDIPLLATPTPLRKNATASGKLTNDQARATYAATGIWPLAPNAPRSVRSDQLEGVYEGLIDPKPSTRTSAILQDAETYAQDIRPVTPASPAQAGTVFDLDARGLVVATDDGATSPDGIQIFAGTPPIKPESLPNRIDATNEPAVVVDPAVARLAAFRPRIRPEALIALNDDPVVADEEGALLQNVGLRPRGRPADLPGRTTTPPRNAAAAATLSFVDINAVNDAITEATESENDTARPQTVVASLKPPKRPASLSRRAEPSAAERQPVRSTQRAAPRIPTSTSVARQATQTNAIKLRKVNLIGVYGSDSSRRALVRLSNGRYRKVEVGDRLDGGRVSAIDKDELRYSKSGRSLVLKIPNG